MKKIKTTRLFSSITFLLFGIAAINAQTTVHGKIVDAASGETLIGASIELEGTSAGTITDVDGSFTLTNPAPLPWNLKISYTGYISQTIKVEDATKPIDIAMGTDALQLMDVVVTANKKAQSAQRVPMSISTLSPVEIRRSGADEFRDFASGIPNLAFGTQGSGASGRYDNGISIRGIEGRNTTALYLDETPLPANFSPRLVDLVRVEVLKGPQGTLYGSRNMGGAVKIITNQPNPKHQEGAFGATVSTVKEGDLNYGAEGMYNLPINEKIALRMNGFYDFESGIFDKKILPGVNIINESSPIAAQLPDGTPFNISSDGCPGCNLKDQENVDDETNYGFSAALGFFPTDKISITPKIMLQNQSGKGYDFAEGTADNYTQLRASGVPESFEDDWKFYSLTGEFKLGAGTIVSSTSYLDREIQEREDAGEAFSETFGLYNGADLLDFFGGNIDRAIIEKQFNQELRFQSNLGGKLDFTAGAFYGKNENDQIWFSNIVGFNPWIALNVYGDPDYAADLEANPTTTYDFQGNYQTREFALFGEMYYALTPRLKATLGLRYFNATASIDSKETGFLVDNGLEIVKGEQKESGVNPKFNLTYEINKDKLAYATVAKGFRLGNLNDVVSEIFCADELAALPGGTYPASYASDYLWNYELGYKATWANGKLITNAAVFYNDWQNLQQERVFNCGYAYISNVGSAHTLGFELEVKAKPVKGLDLGAGFGLVQAELDEVGESLDGQAGDRILFTPPFTANASVQYSRGFKKNSLNSWYFRADLQYVGERLNTFSPEALEEASNIFPAYSLLDARAGISFGQFEFSLFAENLTNTAANYGIARAFGGEIAGRPRFSRNRPLTIGLEGRYFF